MIPGIVLQPLYINMTQNLKHIEFLNWLKTRLSVKHKDIDADIFANIEQIICLLQPKPLHLDKSKIKKICKRFYPGFDFDKDESSFFDIGYSKKEKLEILNHVSNIILEYNK